MSVYTGASFSAFLVDGGHSFKCAFADLWNARPLCTGRALVICDDVRDKPKHPWEVGPSKAWQRAWSHGILEGTSMQGGLAWGHFLPAAVPPLRLLELQVKKEVDEQEMCSRIKEEGTEEVPDAEEVASPNPSTPNAQPKIEVVAALADARRASRSCPCTVRCRRLPEQGRTVAVEDRVRLMHTWRES